MFGAAPSGIYELTSPATYTGGTWHMAVVTAAAESETKASVLMYVDGSLVAGSAGDDPISGSTTAEKDYAGYWHLGWAPITKYAGTWTDTPSTHTGPARSRTPRSSPPR